MQLISSRALFEFKGFNGLRFITSFVFVLLICASGYSQSRETELVSLLKRDFKFSDADLAALSQGRVVAKSQSTKDKREISVIGIAKVNVTQDLFLKRVRDIVTFKHDPAVLQIGKFNTPPRLVDLQGLTLESEDITDLKSCKIGDCALKLSAPMIDRLSQEALTSGSAAKDRVNAAFREMLFEYVKKYLEAGDPALIEYSERKQPLKLKDDFDSLLATSPMFKEYAPEMASYLQQYPAGQLPDVENFVYWSKEKFGLKPVVSITHITIYPRTKDNSKEVLITSKQLFADHYFDSSLGWSIFAEQPADSQLPGTYLIYINRSRADAIKGFMTGLRRSIVESRSLTALKKNLQNTRLKLERGAK